MAIKDLGLQIRQDLGVQLLLEQGTLAANHTVAIGVDSTGVFSIFNQNGDDFAIRAVRPVVELESTDPLVARDLTLRGLGLNDGTRQGIFRIEGANETPIRVRTNNSDRFEFTADGRLNVLSPVVGQIRWANTPTTGITFADNNLNLVTGNNYDGLTITGNLTFDVDARNIVMTGEDLIRLVTDERVRIETGPTQYAIGSDPSGNVPGAEGIWLTAGADFSNPNDVFQIFMDKTGGINDLGRINLGLGGVASFRVTDYVVDVPGVFEAQREDTTAGVDAALTVNAPVTFEQELTVPDLGFATPTIRSAGSSDAGVGINGENVALVVDGDPIIHARVDGGTEQIGFFDAAPTFIQGKAQLSYSELIDAFKAYGLLTQTTTPGPAGGWELALRKVDAGIDFGPTFDDVFPPEYSLLKVSGIVFRSPGTTVCSPWLALRTQGNTDLETDARFAGQIELYNLTTKFLDARIGGNYFDSPFIKSYFSLRPDFAVHFEIELVRTVNKGRHFGKCSLYGVNDNNHVYRAAGNFFQFADSPPITGFRWTLNTGSQNGGMNWITNIWRAR